MRHARSLLLGVVPTCTVAVILAVLLTQVAMPPLQGQNTANSTPSADQTVASGHVFTMAGVGWRMLCANTGPDFETYQPMARTLAPAMPPSPAPVSSITATSANPANGGYNP